MRQPLQLAAASKGAGEQTLCVLTNILYMFGYLDTLDTEAIRDRLRREWRYRNAGELLSVIFLLREGNFQVHAVGETDVRGRMERWLGTEAVTWFGHRLTETPRHPFINDINVLIEEDCAVIATVAERYDTGEYTVPASLVIIAGSVVYSPLETGAVVPYEQDIFENHWDIHKGIIAVHPA